MSEQKKNPVITELISIIPSAISAITSIVKDKREKKLQDAIPVTTGEISGAIKDITSGTLSSKRILNIAGSGLIVTLAVSDITVHGLSKLNLILIGIGVVYSLGMSFLTFLSERK